MHTLERRCEHVPRSAVAEGAAERQVRHLGRHDLCPVRGRRAAEFRRSDGDDEVATGLRALLELNQDMSLPMWVTTWQKFEAARLQP